MVAVSSELEKARQNLLDLTMRNRLLNYRQTSARSVRVIGELPAEIYEALVLRERALEFRGTGIRSEQKSDGIEVEEASSESDPSDEWRPRSSLDLAPAHTDRYLQTPYDDESLGKKLFRVYHEGRSAVEEQGYTVVHLAVGFLEWFESDDSDQPRRAPLILIPVELERIHAGNFSKVKWTGEDVFANISLIAKLVEQGVALPSFDPPEEKDAVDAWIQQVVEAISKKPRWRVLSEMTLDFFSFTKFVMFKDLDPATWPADQKPQTHPLLKTLFEPVGVPSTDDGFDEREIDVKLTARDLWHVRDADPSQIAVIEDVKAGRNLVVQGPPGTGKSQTITNLVAETLAAGKTVLFVSEKMAALEVVKSRLDEAGVGPFCLELHSRKANKKAVLTELQRALNSQPIASALDRSLDEHEMLKRELNRYASELGKPIGMLAATPYQLFEQRQHALSHFEGVQRVAPPLPPITAPLELDRTSVIASESALRDIADAVPLLGRLAAHPWRHSSLESMLPHEESEVHAMLVAARKVLQDVVAATMRLTSAGTLQPCRLSDVERALHAADVLARATAPVDAAVLMNADWNMPNASANELIGVIETCQRERTELDRLFTPATITGDAAALLDEFRPLAGRFFRIFSRRYRELRKELTSMYVSTTPATAQIVNDFEWLVRHQQLRSRLRNDARGKALFGSAWRADDSDVRDLREFSEWIVAFRREMLTHALTERAVTVMSAPVDAAALRSNIDVLRESAAALHGQVDAFVERVQLDTNAAFGEPLASLTFEHLDAALCLWEGKTSDLFRWSRFNAARKTLAGTAAATLEPAIISDRIHHDDLLHWFRAAVADSLLRIIFAECSSLGGFVGELHEKKIARFREIDGGLTELNRVRLSRRLHERRPLIGGGASRNSEVGILLGEFNRKRAHMPIRKLISQAGALIQRIKPCFLMSPLSIAQFLDPRSARFDLIIFDEASQVRPEDALGALLRGNQLVVMGDTQQLPPTSFFDHLTGSDDEPDDDAEELQSASIVDVESILHQCARSYPTKMLNWHYRSRHESLIAVSNVQFYENSLRVYPSAIDWADDIGLHFVHLPHSIYDRGRSSTNRVEARAVAAAAVEHYRRFPGKSLGVGTFNIKQQQAILEEVELQLKAHPDVEPSFKSGAHEHFFVKNLETIQGDERDVIFISVGYGRDSAGKLSLNFGPVNRDGGERRLNVLISRAREKCVVFSNFTANDLPLESTSGKGLLTLKSFLEYAQTRRLVAEVAPQPDTDSPFEDAVEAVVRASGYDVRKQVGCAGFRVDLGVVDPDERGRYVLGIECDGAKYHSSPVARDRDRLRQQILENLGWKIHRIWSTDWYRNRSETVERLLRAIGDARSAPRSVLSPITGSEAPYTSSFTADVYEEETVVYDYTPTEVEPGFSDIPPYEVCRSVRIPIAGELHLISPENLALAVEDIVRVETPIHIDEVVRRIRTLWGLQRAGNRIREAIERGVRVAAVRGKIAIDGDFLTIPNAAIRLRRRNGDPPARIEHISDAEIAVAVRHVLRTQFATSRDDLITTSARRFGIQATSAAAAARIDAVITRMVADGELTVPAGGEHIRLKDTV